VLHAARLVTSGGQGLRPSLGRSAAVLGALIVSDLRARYGRGRSRMAKWLLDPFAALGVYLVLVAFVLDRPEPAPALSIACAVVPFQLVIMVVASSMTSIRLRRSIILNMRFDRRLIPPSTVLTETVAFGGALALLGFVMALSKVTPTVHVLWLLVFVPLTVLFALGLSYPATLFGIWFRELIVFAMSVVRTLFFLAPGLVALDTVPDTVATLLKLNPLTGLFEGYRDALLYGQAPEAWEVLVPLAFSVGLLAVFVPLWTREQGHIAKVVE
jgi:ABC-type polysaccharide/polyol phosphate export permease